MDNTIKQDINFLEHPLWMQSERDQPRVTNFTDIDGYMYEAAGGTPSKVDMIILYYLILEAQSNDWDPRIELSQYKILKACGIVPSKEKKKRLEQSLHKWKRVTISFSGTFYSGEAYEIIEFGIINDWSLAADNKTLSIELNGKWLQKIQSSKFYKWISFTQIKSIRSPLAIRLYEILIKTFYRRNIWEIDIKKLADKIPMSEKYIAHIIPKVEAATARIKKKTELDVSVKIVRQDRGKGKFIFCKNNKCIEVLEPGHQHAASTAPFGIFLLIPKQHRPKCVAIANKIKTEAGEECLEWCIRYVLDAASKKTVPSFGGYLRTAYQEGYWKPFQEEEMANAQLEETKHAKAVEKEQRRAAKEQKDTDTEWEAKRRKGLVKRLEEVHPDQFHILREEANAAAGDKAFGRGIIINLFLWEEIDNFLKRMNIAL